MPSERARERLPPEPCSDCGGSSVGEQADPTAGQTRPTAQPPVASPASGRVGLWALVARLHIVAIGALGTLTFGWLFTGRYPWLLCALSGLDWFLVNLLNRAVDLDEDRANHIAGTELAARHRRAIVTTGFGLLGASLLASHLLVPAVTPWRVGYHLLGLAYNWPLLPGRRRLKQLYFWKNSASAAGFALTCFAYPLAANDWAPFRASTVGHVAPDIGPATVLLALGFFLLFEISYEILYDLRDVVGDRAAGLRTYPVVHGPGGALRIVDALLVSSLLPLVAGYAWGVVPWRLAIMSAAPLLQLGATKLAVRRRAIDSRFCIAITWLGASLLLTYHVWIALELPGAEGWS